MALPILRVAEPDDGSILVEWIFKNFRVGLSIEPDIKESSWWLVSNDTAGNRMDGGRILDEDFSESVSKAAKFVADYLTNSREIRKRGVPYKVITSKMSRCPRCEGLTLCILPATAPFPLNQPVFEVCPHCQTVHHVGVGELPKSEGKVGTQSVWPEWKS